MTTSPYLGIAAEDWPERTRALVDEHPLGRQELVDVVLASWHSIFESSIGPKGFKMGPDIQPKPQILAFFLHELIALELVVRHPKLWRGEEDAKDKDLVYIPNDHYSIEVKTSSHLSQIFGNRSYAQEGKSSKKSKSGYYLAINFEKLTKQHLSPRIRRIRFGWLDHSDWTGQTAATGQQSRLSPSVERGKLLTLFDLKQA
jgi:hypothetical protein